MKLTSNSELKDYLDSLAVRLTDKGLSELAGKVGSASKQSAGLSTEFLGESMLALREVARATSTIFSEPERKQLTIVLRQVEFVLLRK